MESVSPAAADYAYRLIDPDGHDPKLAPSPVPIRGTAVKTRLVQDLKSRYVGGGTEGALYGEVLPTLDNTVSLSSNAAVTPAVIGTTPQSVVLTGNATPQWSGVNAGSLTGGASMNMTFDSVIGTSFFVTSQSGVHSPYFDLTHGAIGHALDVRVQLSRANYVSEVSTTATSIQAGQTTRITLPISSWASAGPTGYITVEARSSNGGTFDYRLYGNSGTPDLFFGYPQDQSTTQVVPLEILADVADLQTFKLTALGILGSYQGSDLANGGRVACARVPRSWSPDEDDILSAIAKLPYDSYEGALKDGFHMHWQPSSVSDLIPEDGVTDSAPPLYKYVFAIAADDKTQSFRLRVTAHVEYFSTSSAYGAMNYAPSGESLAVMLHYLAESVPLATSNDSHLREKLMRLVKGAGKSGIRYVLAHPELLGSLSALL